MDDSSTVAEITKAVCARIGLQNPEEFSFITEEETAEMTLKRVRARGRERREREREKRERERERRERGRGEGEEREGGEGERESLVSVWTSFF